MKISVDERNLATLHYTMGTDIMGYMEDPNVIEVFTNPDGRLWIDTLNADKLDTGKKIDPQMARQLIYQIASITGQICTGEEPLLAAELPDGSRFQGFLPKVVVSPAFNIRKHSKCILSLDDYVKGNAMTEKQRQVILQAIDDKKNIIAAGGTSTGKTTLLNALLMELSKRSDRIVMIEDTPELQCSAKDCLSLRTTNTCDMDMLLKATLRATPDRIVVGEVRGKEALVLLDAWSTGHGGGCSTVHSNSAQLTLLRLQNLVSRVSTTPQQYTIAEAVDIIIYITRKGGRRFIEEIIAVEGWDETKQQYIIQKIA